MIKSRILLSTVGMMALAGAAHAQVFGVATNYNLFTTGNATVSNSDVEGKVAVGGNYSSSSYSVGLINPGNAGSNNTLVVGGNATLNGGTVYGDVVYGGTYSASNQNVTGTHHQGSPINFAAAATDLINKSNTWGALSATGSTLLQYGGAYFTGINAGLNVFNLDGSQMNSLNHFHINVPTGSTILINVTGTTVATSYGGYELNGHSLADTGFAGNSNILWNFKDATSLDLHSIGGSIFAPKANVTSNYNAVNGQIIAKTFTGTGQTNYHPFTGNLPGGNAPVPEPASMLVLGGGVAALLRRRKSAR
jgi:choice-of-anchor A domain-containing protein